MKVLKGIALGLVGLFLFIALPLLVLAFTINSTVLNPQFMVTETQKLDVVSMARDALADQIPPEDKVYLTAIDETLTEQKTWINQQISTVIFSSYDYLLGKTDNLNITISIEALKQSLANNLTQAYLQSPPPGYLQLPAAQQNQQLAQFQQQFQDAIPSTIDINQANMGADAVRTLQQVKAMIGDIRTGYFGLIGFTILMILLIVLIQREIKGIARVIGIIFLIDGALTTAAFFGLKYIIANVIPLGNLPVQVQTRVPQLANDLLFPWGIFSISLLAAGFILLVSSFFFKSRQPDSSITPSAS